MSNKKVLVVTITCDRLEQTKKYLGELKAKGGYPFEHIVVDNGSTDGTVEWLKAEGYNVVLNGANEGIVKAWLNGVRVARLCGFEPDFVVKFDNDCEIATEGILRQIMKFYEQCGEYYIVSPQDMEILPDYVPQAVSNEDTMGDFNVRVTTHTGGMFAVIPIEAFDDMAKHNGGQGIEKDINRGAFWRGDGFNCIYLQDLKVHHRGMGTSKYNQYKF